MRHIHKHVIVRLLYGLSLIMVFYTALASPVIIRNCFPKADFTKSILQFRNREGATNFALIDILQACVITILYYFAVWRSLVKPNIATSRDDRTVGKP